MDIRRSLNCRDSFPRRKKSGSGCSLGPILSTPTISFALHAKTAEEIDVEKCNFHNFGSSVTLTLDWVEVTLVRICGRGLPTHQPPQPFYGPSSGTTGEPVPEGNFWSLWCKGRLTEADTETIRLGATTSGLTGAHLHCPPIFYRPDAFPTAQPTVSKHWKQVPTHQIRSKSEKKLFVNVRTHLSSNLLGHRLEMT